MTELKSVEKKLLYLARKEHLTYDQLKYLFARIRKKLELKPSRKVKRIPELLTGEELRRLIAFGYKEKPLKGLMVRTLLLSGTRVNEFVNIKAEDFRYEDGEIYISTAKGGKNRVVPLEGNLVLNLQQYLGGRKNGYLFETQAGKQLSVRRIQQIVKEVAESAGITKRVYPHLLRHQVATILHNNGMPLEHVQKFLGHNDPKTTQIYAELANKPMKDTYRKALQAPREET